MFKLKIIVYFSILMMLISSAKSLDRSLRFDFYPYNNNYTSESIQEVEEEEITKKFKIYYNYCDTIYNLTIQLYKNFEFDKAIEIIDSNFVCLCERLNYSDKYTSVVDFYLNMYKAKNNLSFGINKVFQLIKKDSVAGLYERMADYCIKTGMYNYLDSAMIYLELDEEFRDKFIYLARANAKQRNKNKMLENLAFYFKEYPYCSKNQILALKEFESYLDDDDFLKIMQMDSNLIVNERLDFGKYDKKIELDTLKKMLKDSYELGKKNNDDLALNIKFDHYKDFAIRHYRKELLDLFINSPKLYFKFMLSYWLILLDDPQTNKQIIKEFENYNFDNYNSEGKFGLYDYEGCNKYETEIFILAKTNPYEIETLLRRELSKNISGLDSIYFDIEDTWSSKLTLTFLVSQPYSDDILYDSLKSKNPIMKEYAIYALTYSMSEKFVPLLSDMIIKEKNDYERNKLIHYLSNIPLPVTITNINKLKIIFPADSFYLNECIYKINNLINFTKGSFYTDRFYRSHIANTIKKIKSPKAKKVFLSNLLAKQGEDVDFIPDLIFNTCTYEDIPFLEKLAISSLTPYYYQGFNNWKSLKLMIAILKFEVYYELQQEINNNDIDK